jgi:hypothetical protein
MHLLYLYRHCIPSVINFCFSQTWCSAASWSLLLLSLLDPSILVNPIQSIQSYVNFTLCNWKWDIQTAALQSRPLRHDDPIASHGRKLTDGDCPLDLPYNLISRLHPSPTTESLPILSRGGEAFCSIRPNRPGHVHFGVCFLLVFVTMPSSVNSPDNTGCVLEELQLLKIA